MAIEEIYILHHTHVDVGYTDVQWVIQDRHVEFIGQALDFCAQTDDYPDDSKFRWINEFSWPVVEFLRQRPERADELFARAREGRVEVCGLFLDPTELVDQRGLEMSMQPALGMARDQGFPVTTVMTTDIPGQGWGLADVIVEQGLKYLSVSPNAMVSKPVEVDRPFYWVGPKGSRVLTWLTDWRKGWYGEGHVLGFPHGFETMRENTAQYLQQLQSEGYPWRALALHMGADNYPPMRELPDLVREWNEQGDLPRMRLATNGEFFDRMIELHGGEFPEHRAAWPDWWSEGMGSGAYESALARETNCRLARIEALQERLGDTRDLWPIYEELLLFEEHTWGCSAMALEPHSFNSRATWAHKSSYAYRAWDRANRLEHELAGQVAESEVTAQGEFRDATVQQVGPGAARVTILNPMQQAYRGPVQLPALAEDAVALTAADGSSLALQRSAATTLAKARAWTIASLDAEQAMSMVTADRAASEGGPRADETVLENEFYRIEFAGPGRVASIVDLETETEVLDQGAPWGFAETIHESITGDQDRMAVWERHMKHMPWGNRRTDAPFRRQGALDSAEVLRVESGPLFASMTWRSSLPWVRHMETEVRLWQGLKRIDVELRLDKQACEAYESLYLAFPFDLDRPRGFLHSCGAVFEAEAEQLPGSCRDYYAVEHFAAMADADRWAVVCPTDTPLVQMGEITFGKWADRLSINRGCIYSWLTNNFWYTNFPGFQFGHLRLRFSVTTGSGAFDAEAAESFGRGVRVGPVVR